ncbi:helix-turn-helix domain-containing protein [Rhizobium rhizogenes]|uniref:helix-turn-helix domain-containing protein n=1 Tax=Rhizobium rhizogenes TaxID=359 RepID=UPI0015740C07|nr:helix-turn-helix domain-containing protein [Rhizobium rhizogenes]NTI74890.1 helix-turn-helix domain-containing protein [Rhizobium rhizogenes]
MSSEKMNTPEAARYIRKSASWLNKTRLTGTGPVYLKIGGSVLYVKSDLDNWLSGMATGAAADGGAEIAPTASPWDDPNFQLMAA